MSIKTADGRINSTMVRATYDYERNTLTLVWKLNLAGVNQAPEVVTVLQVSDMLQSHPAECAALYAWIAAKSIAAGDIPDGEANK